MDEPSDLCRALRFQYDWAMSIMVSVVGAEVRTGVCTGVVLQGDGK